MIMTRGQITELFLSDTSQMPEGYKDIAVNLCRKNLNKLSVWEFANEVKSSWNWDLEIIRANTFIVNH